jgi:hypothetical protein
LIYALFIAAPSYAAQSARDNFPLAAPIFAVNHGDIWQFDKTTGLQGKQLTHCGDICTIVPGAGGIAFTTESDNIYVYSKGLISLVGKGGFRDVAPLWIDSNTLLAGRGNPSLGDGQDGGLWLLSLSHRPRCVNEHETNQEWTAGQNFWPSPDKHHILYGFFVSAGLVIRLTDKNGWRQEALDEKMLNDLLDKMPSICWKDDHTLLIGREMPFTTETHLEKAAIWSYDIKTQRLTPWIVRRGDQSSIVASPSFKYFAVSFTRNTETVSDPDLRPQIIEVYTPSKQLVRSVKINMQIEVNEIFDDGRYARASATTYVQGGRHLTKDYLLDTKTGKLILLGSTYSKN